jgi:two-component sensor histidine kinase
VFKTLGSELKKVGVNCMVGTIDSAQQTIKVEYLSISDEITTWAEKLSIFWPAEILIPRRLWPTDKAITEKTPYWDPNMLESTVKMFPYIPQKIFISSLEKAGMHPNDPICYLPMINAEDVIGILVVWGSNLKHDDIPGFSVFANQVATAIRNTRLYDQAQQEIQERTQAQARIKAALGEKEVLLKEVHHRVKNNLQIISSLLNLQTNQIADQKTRDALRDSQNRVRTMALIHEKLYQSPDLEQVDFAAYLKGLVNFLAQSYRANSNQVLIKTEAQNIYLDIDSAIPCGLIVNELVSNSLKYAFPENREGYIRVSCQQSSKDEVVLIVRDDGAGLPAGFDPSKSSSLGLKLVTSLVQQLNGKLEMENQGGLSYKIAFPKDE